MEGSDKRFGFLLPACAPPGEIVMVAEAPIDTLSLATLQKRKDTGWESRYYLSLGGVSPLALLHLLQNCPQINHIVLGMDNDKAGLEALEKIKMVIYQDEALCDRTLCITVFPPLPWTAPESLKIFFVPVGQFAG